MGLHRILKYSLENTDVWLIPISFNLNDQSDEEKELFIIKLINAADKSGISFIAPVWMADNDKVGYYESSEFPPSELVGPLERISWKKLIEDLDLHGTDINIL
jgi:hypothetical protein